VADDCSDVDEEHAFDDEVKCVVRHDGDMVVVRDDNDNDDDGVRWKASTAVREEWKHSDEAAVSRIILLAVVNRMFFCCC